MSIIIFVIALTFSAKNGASSGEAERKGAEHHLGAVAIGVLRTATP